LFLYSVACGIVGKGKGFSIGFPDFFLLPSRHRDAALFLPLYPAAVDLADQVRTKKHCPCIFVQRWCFFIFWNDAQYSTRTWKIQSSKCFVAGLG
jgi:hypothetical protein